MRIELLGDTSGPKVCKVCHRGFVPHRKQVYCGLCQVVVTCNTCEIEFISNRPDRSLVKEAHYCSHDCRLKALHKNHAPISCSIHGSQSSSFNGECYECRHEVRNISIHCKIHGNQPSSFNRTCNLCNGLQGGRDSAWLIESPDCETHPIEMKQVLRLDGYECWGCVKDQYLLKTSILEIPGSFMQSTYRFSPKSSAGQYAMEQELLEREIEWFAYIKFFNDNNSIEPLVSGKTGSMLVNTSGTDIQFKYDGPGLGCSFLRESELEWETNKILVIPAISEADAYRLESEVAREYNLFYS